MNRISHYWLVSLSLLLAACNLGVPAPEDGNTLATSAAQTVEAVLTASVATPAAINATATLEGPPAGSPGFAASPSAPATCEQSNKIVTWTRNNVTYDKKEVDKRLPPGSSFVMSWVLENNGTCIWDDTYRMTFDSGERLTTQDSIPVMPQGYTVKPGETLTINIQMTAPAKAGEYETSFKLVDKQGDHVLIVGVLTNVGTPSTGNLPAPGDLRYAYDCSGGITRISLTWKDKADGEEGYRIYRDGEKLTDLPAGSTVYDDIAPAPGSYLYTVAAFNASGESPTNVTAETSNCQ